MDTQKNIITAFILSSLIFTQCKKDEFVNLTSSLSAQTDAITLNEGAYAVIQLSLTERLSEDLNLSFNFSTDGITNYINTDDYSTTVEVQADGESSWRSYPNNRVIFPAQSTTAKFRIQTHDDDQLEITEQFKLTIEKSVSSSQITLENTMLPPITVIVNYNEMASIQHNHEYEGGLMVFKFDDNYTPTLVWIKSSIEYPEEKAFIDEGVIPQEMLTDLQTVFRRSTTPITHYIFDYSRGNDLGSFVAPTQDIYGSVAETDAWVMNIDARIAYPYLDSGDKTYNADGLFGYFLFHEWGHIETLNRDTQLNNTINSTNCTTYYEQEGCLNANSSLYLFLKEFYDINREGDTDMNTPKNGLNKPEFVTEYARTNSAEDIAESFAYYITQENIPVADSTNSGALLKINALKNYPNFESYRNLRDEVNTKLSAANELPTHLNRTKSGKRISCLDRKGWALMRKSKKKEGLKFIYTPM